MGPSRLSPTPRWISTPAWGTCLRCRAPDRYDAVVHRSGPSSPCQQLLSARRPSLFPPISRNVPTGTAEDRLFDNGSLRDLVVGKEVRGLPMFGVRFGSVVDLVQYPTSGLVDVLTDVKAPTSFVVGYGFPCVME